MATFYYPIEITITGGTNIDSSTLPEGWGRVAAMVVTATTSSAAQSGLTAGTTTSYDKIACSIGKTEKVWLMRTATSYSNIYGGVMLLTPGADPVYISVKSMSSASTTTFNGGISRSGTNAGNRYITSAYNGFLRSNLGKMSIRGHNNVDCSQSQYQQVNGYNGIFALYDGSTEISPYTGATNRYFTYNNAVFNDGIASIVRERPNLGFTVTVNSSSVQMTINDEVQGYGAHSIRMINVYAVTTGGTETLILSKATLTTISFGITTVSLTRQTTTVNGVKNFKMTFMVNTFNGVEGVEFGVCGNGSIVYPYSEDLDGVEMYTEDISSDITISSSGPVDLILTAEY